ncbi:MAG: hypothetical protein GY838_01335 [bacterium]|nr:hypothetical protein [bacterium]
MKVTQLAVTAGSSWNFPASFAWGLQVQAKSSVPSASRWIAFVLPLEPDRILGHPQY